MQLVIHTDGGARGNPGPAGIGVVVEEMADGESEKREIASFGKTIGDATNNIAEYTAVIEALTFVVKTYKGKQGSTTIDSIHFYLDSTLVVNQLRGLFKIKNAGLRELFVAVRGLETEVGCPIFYEAVPRALNARADFFVNKALDERLA